MTCSTAAAASQFSVDRKGRGRVVGSSEVEVRNIFVRCDFVFFLNNNVIIILLPWRDEWFGPRQRLLSTNICSMRPDNSPNRGHDGADRR